jgi:hypothetical protein
MNLKFEHIRGAASWRAQTRAAVTGVVEESAGAAVEELAGALTG